MASAPARLRKFAWPLGSGLLLAFACYDLIRAGRLAHHAGDFCSHTLYQSLIGLAVVLLLWRGFRGQDKRLRWWPVIVSLSVFLCVEVLKQATRLPRPDGQRDGFPSGHTTYVFALAWLLSRMFPRLPALWYALAVCVGWSRVEGQAHFPYEVLWGAFLGTMIGWWVSHGSSRLLRAFQ